MFILLFSILAISCSKEDSSLSQENASSNEVHAHEHTSEENTTRAGEPEIPLIRLEDHDLYNTLNPILPDKFTAPEIEKLEKGYVWTYAFEGQVVYTIDFEYTATSIIKLLVDSDTDNNIKSINLIETVIKTNNNSISLHNIEIEKVLIYTPDSDRKGSWSRNPDDCMEIVFGTTGGGIGTFGDPTTGGGVSTHTNIGIATPNGGGTTIYDTGDGHLIIIVCGCPPHHVGGSGSQNCVCGLGDQIIIVKKDNNFKDNSNSSSTRDQEYWDCVESLIGCHMLNDYDIAQQTLMHCHGVYDVNDTGPQSGNDGTNQFIGPEFCDDWVDYQQQCLNGSTSQSGVYQPWSHFMVDNPDAFFNIIAALPECVSTEDLGSIDNGNGSNGSNDNSELIECVDIAYEAFITEYGLELTKFEETAIKDAAVASEACDSNFVDIGWVALIEYNHTFLSIYQDFETTNSSYYISTYGYEKYYELLSFYKELEEGLSNVAPEIVPVYILKKIAEAGIGALTDIGLQLVMEYWMGDHNSFADAWTNLEINKFQVASSAMEAIWKNKYASILGSAFVDGMTYITTTSEEDFSWNEFGTQIGFGAISGFIGDKAGEYIQSFSKYFIKYGPEVPTKKLQELNIDQFFFKFKDFRNLFIHHMWLNNCAVCRGALLEAVQKYGRYADDAIVWVNNNGELNGPLDFKNIISDLGIQLKTISHADNWSNFKSKVKNGLNQLNTAIANGDVTTGRLDIMMPDNLSGNFAQWKDDLYAELINHPDFIEYEDLNVVIGSFLE
ncbi:MAG: hypothetical protein ACJATI_005230 [Halioglobus sp.]